MIISDTTLSIILTALPPTLVAIATLIVSIINSMKADKIHVLVNSNMAKVQADLAIANMSIKELQGRLVSLSTTINRDPQGI